MPRDPGPASRSDAPSPRWPEEPQIPVTKPGRDATISEQRRASGPARNQMSTSDILAVAGLVVSAIGIPLAYVLARRGRKRPLLRYVVDFDQIATPEKGFFGPGVLQSSQGEPVTRISRTCVAIWNHQGDTVRGVDIIPDDKLRIKLPRGDSPLFVRVSSRSRQQNALMARADPNNTTWVLVDFDFLDAGDGGVVEIIHQGDRAPTVLGTVRGAEITLKGKATLTQNALKLASRSRVVRSFMTRKIQTLIAAFYIVAMFTIWTVFTSTLSREPSLVATTGLDLMTLEGQREFAKEVIANGLPISEAGWLQWPMLVAALLMVALFLSGGSSVPRSIVRIIEKESTSSQPVTKADYEVSPKR